jgi:hypothetical protein
MSAIEAFATCRRCRFNLPVKIDKQSNSLLKLTECPNCGYLAASQLESFVRKELPQKPGRPFGSWQQFVIAGYQSAEIWASDKPVVVQEETG